jgi:hypothetical protein
VGAPVTVLLWDELGASMRRARRGTGLSLRQAQVRSGYSKGMLSLAENAKARPSRQLVHWYDEQFAADGLLLSIYAEALTASVPDPLRSVGRTERPVEGDAMTCIAVSPPSGHVAAPGAELVVRWTVRNAGTVAWVGRALRRIGAVDGARVLTSERTVPVPDTHPGAEVEVACAVVAPSRVGTVAGFWEIVDDHGGATFPGGSPLSFVVVTR